MKLVYLPLEKYRERYTEWLSDMVKSYIDHYGIPCMAIMPHYNVTSIAAGKVLDPFERCAWGFAQTSQLVALILDGTLKKEDVIYIEDFWLPGFEMIPYTMSQVYGPTREDWPKIFSFCHAQSVDPHDFTAPMAWWMRGMEVAWGKCHDGVFVAAQELRMLLEDANIGGESWGESRVHDVGTVFQPRILWDEYTDGEVGLHNQKRVVFSSRFDEEKNPQFFLQVAQRILAKRKDINFAICSGRQLLTTNQEMLDAVVRMENDWGHQFSVYTNLSKAQYYRILQGASIQFNCASQDFVSYTLLEAAYFGCFPVYPAYLTFPDALNHNPKFLYTQGSVEDACRRIEDLIDNPGTVDPDDLAKIYQKYQRSFPRMLNIMGFNVGLIPTLEEEHLAAKK